MGDLAAFLVQIRVHDARHQLHEQHDADDAEEIRDAVADRDRVLILGGDGLLRGGKRRGRGQRAGEQAGDHGRQLTRVIARLPGLDGPADEQAQDRGEAAGEDDHRAQQHVGLEVVLHVLEEVRPGDKADRGHEEHEAQVFDDLQRLRGVVDLFDDEAGIEACAEKRAVDQRDDKDAGRAEADPLDGDPPEQIADRGDPEDGEHQEIRSVDGSSHLFSPLIFSWEALHRGRCSASSVYLTGWIFLA